MTHSCESSRAGGCQSRRESRLPGDLAHALFNSCNTDRPSALWPYTLHSPCPRQKQQQQQTNIVWCAGTGQRRRPLLAVMHQFFGMLCGGLQACRGGGGRQVRGASWSSWTRLAPTRLTWRFCAPGWSCVRSSWTRCAFTRLTQHGGCRGPASSSSTRWRTSSCSSKVFVHRQIVDISVARREVYAQCKLCRKPLVSTAIGGRHSCEQQRQVPAAHPCLVQTVQSSVPVEVPRIRSSISRLWRRGVGVFSPFLLFFSHSVRLDVECPAGCDFFEPSMANPCCAKLISATCGHTHLMIGSSGHAGSECTL